MILFYEILGVREFLDDGKLLKCKFGKGVCLDFSASKLKPKLEWSMAETPLSPVLGMSLDLYISEILNKCYEILLKL